MALTNNNLEIIKAIAKNDVHRARMAAMASLAEDTSKNCLNGGVSIKGSIIKQRRKDTWT